MAHYSIGPGTTQLPRAANGRRPLRLEMPLRGVSAAEQQLAIDAGFASRHANGTDTGWTRGARYPEFSLRRIFPARGFEIPAHCQRQSAAGPVPFDYGVSRADGERRRSRARFVLPMRRRSLTARDEKGNRNEIEGKHIVGIFDEFLPDGSPNRAVHALGMAYLALSAARRHYRRPAASTSKTSAPGSRPSHLKNAPASNQTTRSLSQIWQIGWRTARLDAHDTYMDTPYWERMQYIGDTRIQALISYTRCRRRSPRSPGDSGL